VSSVTTTATRKSTEFKAQKLLSNAFDEVMSENKADTVLVIADMWGEFSEIVLDETVRRPRWQIACRGGFIRRCWDHTGDEEAERESILNITNVMVRIGGDEEALAEVQTFKSKGGKTRNKFKSGFEKSPHL
jgi:hypothetical protein